MSEQQSLLVVRASNGGSRLRLRVKPKASRDAIVGAYGDSLKVTVKEPPEAGRANRAVCALLARSLSVEIAAVSIVMGEGSQNKIVRIDGLSPEECFRRLHPYLS